jgi:hypothetical protein
MGSLHENISEYKKQLEKGVIQRAYQGLMEYIMDLRTQFSKKFPELAPGNIYHGYMDMTYFPVFPKSIKSLKLKIAIVFIHSTIRFEVWLVGRNKQIQEKYWKLFKGSQWNKYPIPTTTKGTDSILEYTLVDDPDFSDLNALTKQIENGTLTFINDIEEFLSEH